MGAILLFILYMVVCGILFLLYYLFIGISSVIVFLFTPLVLYYILGAVFLIFFAPSIVLLIHKGTKFVLSKGL